MLTLVGVAVVTGDILAAVIISLFVCYTLKRCLLMKPESMEQDR